MFIRENLIHKHRGDLDIKNGGIESIFIEIENVFNKNIIIGVIYRPPDQYMQDFFYFNINFLNTTCCHEANDFLNMLVSFFVCIHSFITLLG